MRPPRLFLTLALLAALLCLPVSPARADAAYVEGKLLDHINAGRAAVGEPPLVMHAGLREKMRAHAQYMASIDGLTHDGASTRVATATPDPAEANGAPDDGFGSWCENVAMRHYPGETEDQTASGFYDQWYRSTTGHRECLLDQAVSGLTAAGVGVFQDASGAWWAGFLGIRDATPPATAGGGGGSALDFESPALGAARAVVNPYSASGITFTTQTAAVSDEVVGLVRNKAAIVCVEPKNNDQKLGTGRSSKKGGGIGKFGYPITASFSSPPTPGSGQLAFVRLTVQSYGGTAATLRLLSGTGSEVGRAQGTVPSTGGTCGKKGSARGALVIEATTAQAVASAVVDAGGQPFVIDAFSAGVR